MGRIALILVGLATFAGLFVTMGTTENLAGAKEHVAEQQHEILARNAALAGLNKAEQNMAQDFRNYQMSGTFEDVSYVTTVTTSGTHATVTAVGTSHSATGESVELNIHAEYEQFNQPWGIAEEAPPFMGFAVMAEDNLLLNGNVEGDICDICVDGAEAATLNANMHTNHNLHVQGNSASVKGFGTYVGSGTANPNKALNKTFQPNYNPSGGASTQQVLSIAIPALNVPDMAAAMSPDLLTEENVVLTGEQSLGGTREDPFVWHIKGNVTANGGATLNGYVMLLVEGNVTFNGNLEAGGDPDYEGSDESSIGIYATGDVTFGGNVEVWGQILAAGDIWFHGTPDVYGSLTSRRGVHFSGAVDIFYRRASPALTVYWNGDNVTRLRRLAYTEW